MTVVEYINYLKNDIDAIRNEIDNIAAISAINYSNIVKNANLSSSVEYAAMKREHLIIFLQRLENKLFIAIKIIKLEYIWDYEINMGQFIERCKLWGLTEKQIKVEFNFTKNEYRRYERAFENYFFSRIKEN